MRSSLAPEQQRRRRDQRQALFELGVAERPEDARRGLAGARPARSAIPASCAPSGSAFSASQRRRIGAHQRRHVGRRAAPTGRSPGPSRRTGRTARSARGAAPIAGQIAAISAASEPPTELPARSAPSSPRLAQQLRAPPAPSRDGCRARYGRARRRESRAATARSRCARAPARRETASSAASRQSRRESRASARCPCARRGRKSR